MLHHAEESPALCSLNNYRAANLIWHQHRHTNCSRQLRGTGVNFVGACVHRCTPLRTMITGHRYCSFGWASDSYDLLQVPHKQVPGFEPAPDHFLHIITLSLPSCRLFVLSYKKKAKMHKTIMRMSRPNKLYTTQSDSLKNAWQEAAPWRAFLNRKDSSASKSKYFTAWFKILQHDCWERAFRVSVYCKHRTRNNSEFKDLAAAANVSACGHLCVCSFTRRV